MRPLAVFDLDGVLADVTHRAPLLERSPKDWNSFFAALARDPVWPQGVELALESAKDCDLLYLTGRPERTRKNTQAWLDRHGLPSGRLLMRGDTDRRPASRVKPFTLRHAARGRIVAVVVDDDAAVCAAYRRAGFPVLQATWATVPDAVSRAQNAEGRS